MIDVDTLLAGVDLPSVIGSFTAIKRVGKEWQARCVFHSPDNNPSLYIFKKESKWGYHCFSCGSSGDAVTFIREMEGLDFKEACARLGAPDTQWKPNIKQPPRKPTPERVTSKPPAHKQAPDSFRMAGLGDPVKTWVYRDTDGGILGYVCRYESDGRKEFRAWTWGTRGTLAEWGVAHFSKPRYIYRLDAIASRQAARVLIVEGEKTCDAAQRLFPANVATTWPGGAQAWKHADWSPLKGRAVTLLPDADEPGRAAMQALAGLLAGIGCSVKIIDTAGMPEGWDVADEPTWTPQDAINWAKERIKPFNDEQPGAGTEKLSEGTGTPESRPGKPVPAPDPTESPLQVEAPQIGIHSEADLPKPADGDPSESLRSDAAQQDVPQPSPPPKTRQRPRLAAVEGNLARQPDPDDVPLPASMSEDHVADEFAAAQQENIRYVAARNQWYVWSGDYWRPDDKREVNRRAVEQCRIALYWGAAAALTQGEKRKVGSKSFAGNVRDLAQSDRRIASTVDQWDRDPMLLGVPGGVVDLGTGKLIEAERSAYITRQTKVAPETGEPTRWLQFLRHICREDDSLLQYLQRWCGYLISGDTSEECLLFCYGPAQRGKSKFVTAMREMLGTYAVTASMDVFTDSKMERHSEEVACLAGARMIVASETEAGRRWNEARIKAMTGRDTMRARMLHENSFEFSLGKIVIAGNHAPALKNVDDTFRRRLHILEFSNPVSDEQIDRHLDDKLRAEYPRILQWCIEGFLAWRDYGLGKPEQISAAVENYLESEDTLAEWMEQAIIREPHSKVLSGDLYTDYRAWSEAAGEYQLSQKRFVQQLTERGFSRVRASGKRYLAGLRLANPPQPVRRDPYA